MPSNFAVGQTLPARINGRDRQVTYRDADTLIIEANGDQPAQTKLISWIEPAGKIKGVPAIMFWCRDPDGVAIERVDLGIKELWIGDRDLARSYYRPTTPVKPTKEG
jgi:hypothetical protein